MVSPLKPNKDLFQTAFGEGLVQYGFPAKIHRKTNCFVQKTQIGSIGVFVNPQTHHSSQGKNAAVTVTVACSIQVVQDVLVETELYDSDVGLTWTFSTYVSALRDQKRSFFDKLRNHFVDPYYEFNASSSEPFVRASAHAALTHFDQFGWPFLETTSMSKEMALNFMTQRDETSGFGFMTKSWKSLSALVLARNMGREDLIPKIFGQTRSWYAKVDNEYDSQKFERLADQLGFAS